MAARAASSGRQVSSACRSFAFLVSLVASERYATYRTVLAMTGVLLCFLVASVRVLTERWNPANLRLLAALVLAGAFLVARHHTYALIAVPQGNEWELILQGAKQRAPEPHGEAAHLRDRLRALPIYRPPSIYHDEFGSLSSNSEWVPKEMFKRAMHDLHPEIANINTALRFLGRL